MNKKVVFSVGIITLGIMLSGCSERKINIEDNKNEKANISTKVIDFKDGIFEGEGDGFDGKTNVSIEIKKGIIVNINILKSNDDDEYLDKAKKIIPIIIKKQSLDVDTISGATISSKGIILAVENALKKSK